ncbi:ribonucleotide reductase assembly protein NrdI [Erwinia sp. OLTSP20]|uniref:class Ib ribonucleoside-diphosphate reductase assembly flavoprotein NrdI n=1 Tax=unclassified Erwinia TaxID=2622719 RepID=UPI000C173DD8|nr:MULTISPECIES: class Ib ribonucleoside-diphosphate reductase assembly flavoprotein NrdI [unclassified Erwinia]PIJ49157.1 ribonucleotide reductase assembly protein NrdI [Erwinia sp. OAMSP11]PIJ70453.1 ribonucleotide reductase assembly protein NrdI [Erwinia sp. OLSSP12]PIJ79946.1 ribonucleotide reductase assembly protein NrdI [Erwinia sp. OLCASP19]PIJ81308.1 ribonucleotide reductase assembly protein NrdI [Erwinia sp. OLMTSP26]PIJ83877.1 ribonucleotide reductase assembly protein NrdI [Erwinia s
MHPLVYFSSQSGNTQRFIERLGLPAQRIPLAADRQLQVDHPFILVVPSYGGGSAKGAVPKQVIQFLNDVQNRARLRGVIAAGNRNFGAAFGLAGDIISHKCQVPWLYRFELMGSETDLVNIDRGVKLFWQRQSIR